MSELDNYFRALSKYASQGWVPAPEGSASITLDEVFVEPRLMDSAAVSGELHGNERKRSESPPKRTTTAESQPALQAIQDTLKIAVLGEPGQGKSVLLLQYAKRLSATREHQRIPMLVELRRKRGRIAALADAHEWLFERMPDALKLSLGGNDRRILCRAISTGDASILLDGYDEIEDEARLQVRELLLTDLLAQNQTVVTSRPHAYRLTPIPGFVEHVLQPPRSIETRFLAARVCAAIARDLKCSDYSPALRKIQQVSSGQAAEMAQNRLLLSFMCLTAIRRQMHDSLETFATRPVALLTDCINALIWWNQQKGVKTWQPVVVAADIVEILARAALKSFEDGSAMIQETTVNQMDSDARGKFNQAVGFLTAARFIVRYDQGWGFGLPTFREYFAALAIAASRNPFAMVRRRMHHPDWQELIVYSAGSLAEIRASRVNLPDPLVEYGPKVVEAGIAAFAKTPGLPDAEESFLTCIEVLISPAHESLKSQQARSKGSTEFFIKSILKRGSKYETILRRDLRLAARCVSGSIGCPDALIRKMINSLIRARPLVRWEYPSEKVTRVRQSFIDAMGAVACLPAGRRLLIKLAEERSFLAHMAQEMGLPLLRWRRRAPECAVRALRRVALETDVQHCLVKQLTDWNGYVCWAAAEGLGEIMSAPEIRDHLLEMTRNHDDYQTARYAVWALKGNAQEPSVLARLVELADTSHEAYHEAVISSMQSVASEPVVQRSLAELINRSKYELRRAIAEMLQPVAGDPAVQAWLLQLTESLDDNVRLHAAEALRGASAAAKVRETLLRLTLDPKHYIRYAAALALEDVSHEESVWRRLVSLIETTPVAWHTGLIPLQGPPDIRFAAVRALRKAADVPTVQETLLNASKSKEMWMKRIAAESLQDVAHQPKVWKRLLELTHETVQGVRWYSIESLQSVASLPEVQERLLALTFPPKNKKGEDDDSDTERMVVAKALGGAASEPKVYKRLIQMTHDNDADVRGAAVSALQNSRNKLRDLGVRRIAKLARKDDAVFETLEILLQRQELSN